MPIKPVEERYLRFHHKEVLGSDLVPGETIPNLCLACTEQEARFTGETIGEAPPILEKDAAVSPSQVEAGSGAGPLELHVLGDGNPSPSKGEVVPKNQPSPATDKVAAPTSDLTRLDQEGCSRAGPWGGRGVPLPLLGPEGPRKEQEDSEKDRASHAPID